MSRPSTVRGTDHSLIAASTLITATLVDLLPLPDPSGHWSMPSLLPCVLLAERALTAGGSFQPLFVGVVTVLMVMLLTVGELLERSRTFPFQPVAFASVTSFFAAATS